jgi:RNA polymerase sigma factor (sigma-70 family)
MDVEVKKDKAQTYLKDHEVKELIKKSQDGDQAARDLIAEKNMRLVWSVVQRFLNRGYDPDDLFQIGCIGLLKSVDKFDLSYDVKFSTYAVPMIIGEIQRFIRDDGTVKVSRSLKEMGNRIRKVNYRRHTEEFQPLTKFQSISSCRRRMLFLPRRQVGRHLLFMKPFMKMMETLLLY